MTSRRVGQVLPPDPDSMSAFYQSADRGRCAVLRWNVAADVWEIGIL